MKTGEKKGGIFFLKMLFEENKFELLVLKQKKQITIISTNVI